MWRKIIDRRGLGNQVFLSFLIKGVSFLLNLYSIKLTFKYLGNEQYGIWITLITTITWVYVFDIGIGNSLRGQLAATVALNNREESKVLVSTSYIMVSALSIAFFLMVIICVPLVNWSWIFKTNKVSNSDFKSLILASFFCITSIFVLNLINQILNAFQKNALSNVTFFLGNITYIILIIGLRGSIQGNLKSITILYCASILFSFVLITCFFFFKNPWLIPQKKYFKKSTASSILKTGLQFFLIQLGTIFIFLIDNFLIAHLLGPMAVSEYNLTYRLFSIFIIIATTILGPFWSAYTVAYVEYKYEWIRNNIKKLSFFLIISLLLVLLLFDFYYQNILDIWMGFSSHKIDKVVPPISLIISMSLFVLISVWNNIYAYFLNGISRTREQLITAIAGSLINIPLALLLVKQFNMGVSGVVIAMCVSLSIFSVIGPIISFKILRK